MSGRAAFPLLLLAAGCPRFDPMQQQQKVEAYEASTFHADGLGMRTPPAGTVEYRSVLPPDLAAGIAADGKPVARLPVETSGELLALGRKRFDVHCAVCHGVLGDGESQVALNMSLRRPPSLHAYRDVSDGHLYQVIANGFGVMPAYAAELTVHERWAVVAYVRALQLSQAASLEQAPPEVRESLGKEAR
jgi:mono/diheme cytochrome c family protein